MELAEAMTVQVADRLQLAAIFATLYIHGNDIPYTTSDGRFQIGSVARINTFLDETRRELGEAPLSLCAPPDPHRSLRAARSVGNVVAYRPRSARFHWLSAVRGRMR